MPYVSQKQRNFFNSPTGRAKIGDAEVDKWNDESRGHAANSQLPVYVPKSRHEHRLDVLHKMMGGRHG